MTFYEENTSPNIPAVSTLKTVAQNSDTPVATPPTQQVSIPPSRARQGSQSSNTPTPPVVTPPPVKKPVSVYKNGTYSAGGAYMTPEGQAAIDVRLTLTNDIITGSSVTSAS